MAPQAQHGPSRLNAEAARSPQAPSSRPCIAVGTWVLLAGLVRVVVSTGLFCAASPPLWVLCYAYCGIPGSLHTYTARAQGLESSRPAWLSHRPTTLNTACITLATSSIAGATASQPPQPPVELPAHCVACRWCRHAAAAVSSYGGGDNTQPSLSVPGIPSCFIRHRSSARRARWAPCGSRAGRSEA